MDLVLYISSTSAVNEIKDRGTLLKLIKFIYMSSCCHKPFNVNYRIAQLYNRQVNLVHLIHTHVGIRE